jgi:hypothetical protein
MGRKAKIDKSIRVNVHLHSEIAAQLSLACADTAFGGLRYGEQTRIVNEALRAYFKGNPVCIQQKQSVESSSSAL